MTLTVQLFVTCLLDTLYPATGRAVVEVLNKAGIRVECPPDQTCCGQPAFNAGMRREARQVARHTIEIFEKTSAPVVIPSGSCCSMIRQHYAELFADEPDWLERAQALSTRCFEFTEFLVDNLGVTSLGAVYPGRIAYHASCHLLRDLGIARQPQTLLEGVSEAQLVELNGREECCGFGGVFSVEHPQLSTAMVERKAANIQKSEADLVVACDAGCITNINGFLKRRHMPGHAVHIADLLNNQLPPRV